MDIDHDISEALNTIGCSNLVRPDWTMGFERKTSFRVFGRPHTSIADFSYIFDPDTQQAKICNLRIAPYARGKGAGAAISRAFLKTAKNRGIPFVTIKSIRADGFSFWPTLGAYPSKFNEQRFQRALSVAANEYYECSDHAVIDRALNMIRDGVDLKAVWKSIARKQKEGGPTRKCLADITRDTLFADMLLDLTDADVLQRLGLTPQPKGI